MVKNWVWKHSAERKDLGLVPAQMQHTRNKIVLAAMRFLLLLTDGRADMVGRSPHFVGNIFVAGELQVNERCRARYCISVACGRHWLSGF